MSGDLWTFGLPLAIALIGFIALWPLSLRLTDVGVVDLLWGPGFLVQMLIAASVLGDLDSRGVLLLGLIAVWSLRLSWLLLRRRRREGREDPRYDSIRRSWGAGFWWKSLFIVFVLQAVIQWTIVIGPISVLTADTIPLGWLAWTGAMIAGLGLALESVADQQLDEFKKTQGHGICMTGLRAYIRHPNYLGEIVFWTGLAFIGIEGGAWLALMSPVLLIVFLTRISGAPLIEERLETRPGYADYRARVPGFIPWTRAQHDC